MDIVTLRRRFWLFSNCPGLINRQIKHNWVFQLVFEFRESLSQHEEFLKKLVSTVMHSRISILQHKVKLMTEKVMLMKYQNPARRLPITLMFHDLLNWVHFARLLISLNQESQILSQLGNMALTLLWEQSQWGEQEYLFDLKRFYKTFRKQPWKYYVMWEAAQESEGRSMASHKIEITLFLLKNEKSIINF